MQFQCDHCGKRYSTSQEIREGRSYRFTCRSCGSAVIVRGGPGEPPTPPAPVQASPPTPAPVPHAAGSRNGASAGAHAPQQPRPASTPAPRPAPPAAAAPATSPRGSLEFRLDEEAVRTQFTTTRFPPAPADPPAPAAPEPARPPPPAFGRPAEAPAPARSRRGIAIAAVVAVSAAAAVGGVLYLGGSKPGPEGTGGGPGRTPGLLTPVVYVGPIGLEQQGAHPPPPPAAAAPSPPPARPVARAEPPPARKAAKPERAPARPVRQKANPARPGAATASAPATAPEPEPEPEPADPDPPAPPPAAGPAPEPVAPPQAAPVPVPAGAAAAAAPQATEEEAPAYARSGFRPPEAEVPRCVESSIRIPRDLAERLPPSVTLRFAVGRDGRADRVQVLGEPVDARLTEALRAAVAECRFVPGADEQGRPIRLWVVLPLRFAK